MSARSTDPCAATVARAWQALATVMDPELPQLSLLDLGMIRSVEALEADVVCVGVSPTYSGCPALRVIRSRIRDALQAQGIARIDVRDVLSPAWTSDWITERGRAILRDCGIAPPAPAAQSGRAVSCPRCNSTRTERVSEFGSTACKAQYRCLECLEPFEYFKCI